MKHIMAADPSIQPPAALKLLRSWYLHCPRIPVPRSSSPSPLPGQPGSSQAEGVQLNLDRYVLASDIVLLIW